MRPNSGKIPPGGQVEVQVLLQAMKKDPPPDARCRDKFLVQSVNARMASSDDTAAQIWSSVDLATGAVREKRIRVNFLPADDDVNNGIKQEPAPPSYRSLSPEQSLATAVTPQRVLSDSTSGEKSPETDTKGMSGSGSGMGSGSSAGMGGLGASAASMASREGMRQQLEEAKATIARLQQQAAEGIRQRKPQEMAEKATGRATDYTKKSVQQVQQGGGVPVPIVATLCLLCFLIAYLFF